jgi:hypothetical protein
MSLNKFITRELIIMLESVLQSTTKVTITNTNIEDLSIVDDRYSEANWSRLASRICDTTFKLNHEKDVNSCDGINSYKNLEKCLISTSLIRHPTMYDFVKEFTYYGTTKLSGTKIFAVEILNNISLEFKVQVLIKRIVEKMSSKAKSDENYLIAMYKSCSSEWEIAVVHRRIKCPQFSNGERLLSMGQYYIAVAFYAPQEILRSTDSKELRHDGYVIKL